jgi:GTP cyclohydrolase I
MIVKAISEGIRIALIEMGEDLSDPNLARTPMRVAKWIAEFGNHKTQCLEDILQPRFPEEHQELVIVKDIQFTALCAHHMLPFRGSAAVAYIPKSDVVGISKLDRAVQFYANRLTLQERITKQVADGIMSVLEPKGVMVVLYNVEHQCMTIRGVKDPHARTTTSAVRGCFETNLNGCKEEVLQLLRT